MPVKRLNLGGIIVSISHTITDFVTLAIQAGGWMELDRLYLQNRVLAMVGEESLDNTTPTAVTKTSFELLDELVVQAVNNNCVEKEEKALRLFEAQLMDFLTPPPSVVNALFAQHYEKDPAQATDYFYKLNQQNNYINTQEMTQTTIIPIATEYGQLEIQTRLEQTEKYTTPISTEVTSSTAYPKCVFCMENEGYKGRNHYPARTTHRVIRMNLAGESWGFHYMPSGYFQEHSIISSEEHRPMTSSKIIFQRLLRIVSVFPHYFVGFSGDLSNSEVHDHYQTGRQVLPIEKAEIEQYFELQDFPLMNAGILKWPLSVIRLQSPNSEDLVEAASFILEKWQNYTDESGSIQSFSPDRKQQHTITPIARRKGQLVEMDLVLQDNQFLSVDAENFFHYEDSHDPIKKVTGDLAKIMGVAVLPPCFAEDLIEIESYVLDKENRLESKYRGWADQLKKENTVNESNVKAIIQKEVGQAFVELLANASVYKQTQEGQDAFQRFIEYL